MRKFIELKHLNAKEKELLSNVVISRSITRRELSKQLELKNATLYRMIDSLISRGMLIASRDLESNAVGRPTENLELNPDYGYFYALNIRRFSYEASIIDFGMNIIKKVRKECNSSFTPHRMLSECVNIFEDFKTELALKEKNNIGVAISSFSESTTNNYPGFSWNNITSISEFFKTGFPELNIFSGKGAIAAACSTYRENYFPEYKNLGYVILDEGIGIGCMIDHKIPRESMRNINALGHMTIDINGPLCKCGKYGCLEALVNNNVIVENTRKALKIRRTGFLADKIENLTIRDICEAAENKDPIAQQELEYAASILSIGIENYMNIFQLEVIIITGEVLKGFSYFTKELRRKLQERHKNLIIEADDNECDNTLKGISEWMMFEILSNTPIQNIIV